GEPAVEDGAVFTADIETGLVERFLERHAVVDEEGQHLRYGRHDAAATGGAERETGRAVAADDPRAPVGEGAGDGGQAGGPAGRGSNHRMPLFMRMPVSGSTTLEPKRESSVCVSAAMLPWRSTTLRWVVQLGAGAPSPSCSSRVA